MATDAQDEKSSTASLSMTSHQPQRDEENHEIKATHSASYNGDDIEQGAPHTSPESVKDPNVIDWDGPLDPQNPLNWPLSKKVVNITILSLITFLSYVIPHSVKPSDDIANHKLAY